MVRKGNIHSTVILDSRKCGIVTFYQACFPGFLSSLCIISLYSREKEGGGENLRYSYGKFILQVCCKKKSIYVMIMMTAALETYGKAGNGFMEKEK